MKNFLTSQFLASLILAQALLSSPTSEAGIEAEKKAKQGKTVVVFPFENKEIILADQDSKKVDLILKNGDQYHSLFKGGGVYREALLSAAQQRTIEGAIGSVIAGGLAVGAALALRKPGIRKMLSKSFPNGPFVFLSSAGLALKINDERDLPHQKLAQADALRQVCGEETLRSKIFGPTLLSSVPSDQFFQRLSYGLGVTLSPPPQGLTDSEGSKENKEIKK